MPDFPNQVNTQPAAGVEGDFCDSNPRFTANAGPGGFVAGPGGVTVGRFCWYYPGSFDPDSTPQQVTNQLLGVQPFGGTNVVGFVHRAQQGLITQYLQASGMLIPQGFPVTVFSGGGFFAKNAGTNEAILGMKAYANFSNGAVTFAATLTPTTATCSGSIGPQTVSFTGSIAGNVLTVSAVSAGTLNVGAVLTGGTGLVTNTTVVSQLSGTTGGVGSYSVNIPEQTVASASLTGTYGLLTVTGTPTGTLAVGQTLSGSGITAGTYISAMGTGAGGSGTYYVSPSQTVGAITVTFASNVETKWFAMSGGLPGELVKISSHPLG
jgi:hypothetical protein